MNVLEAVCCGCGANWESAEPFESDRLAELVAGHLRECPCRLHPAFGFMPRWQQVERAAGGWRVEFTWTSAEWGLPFHLGDVIPPRKPRLVEDCPECGLNDMTGGHERWCTFPPDSRGA